MAKSNVKIAKEVYAGKWGNGLDRKKKLTEAGYNYDVIQILVNKLANGESIDNTNVEFKSAFTKCINAIEKLPEFKKLCELL